MSCVFYCDFLVLCFMPNFCCFLFLAKFGECCFVYYDFVLCFFLCFVVLACMISWRSRLAALCCGDGVLGV